MKLNYKVAMILVCFLAAFPWHFVYDVFPSKLTAIFFPINESIFEHMKILVGTFLVTNLLFFKFLKNKNNVLFFSFVGCVLLVGLYLLLFLPFYYLFKENLIYSIGLILVVDMVVYHLFFKFIKNKGPNLDILGVVLLSLLFIGFGYLTYHPLLNDLFLDPILNKYGFSTYRI